MKISQLIRDLANELANNGDLDLVFCDERQGHFSHMDRCNLRYICETRQLFDRTTKKPTGKLLISLY